jgi:hypothetical protein
MKKLLLILSLSIMAMACSRQQEPFLATNIKKLTFEDSNGKPITLNVEYWFGMPNDTEAPINSMIIDEEDFQEFVHQLFFDTGFFNDYLFAEYSYTPIRIYDWKITDTLQYKNATIYVFRYFVEYRENNQKKTSPRNMYAWHEVWDNVDKEGIIHDKIRKWWLMDLSHEYSMWYLQRLIDNHSH